MEITPDAAKALAKAVVVHGQPVRFLVQGGGIHGVSVRVFCSREGLEGDNEGTVGETRWVVDPVSWQYLSAAKVDVGSRAGQLHVTGVPEVGPGPGEGRIIILEIDVD